MFYPLVYPFTMGILKVWFSLQVRELHSFSNHTPPVVHTQAVSFTEQCQMNLLASLKYLFQFGFCPCLTGVVFLRKAQEQWNNLGLRTICLTSLFGVLMSQYLPMAVCTLQFCLCLSASQLSGVSGPQAETILKYQGDNRMQSEKYSHLFTTILHS